jgi:hypothetical protein
MQRKKSSEWPTDPVLFENDTAQTIVSLLHLLVSKERKACTPRRGYQPGPHCTTKSIELRIVCAVSEP